MEREREGEEGRGVGPSGRGGNEVVGGGWWVGGRGRGGAGHSSPTLCESKQRVK